MIQLLFLIALCSVFCGMSPREHRKPSRESMEEELDVIASLERIMDRLEARVENLETVFIR